MCKQTSVHSDSGKSLELVSKYLIQKNLNLVCQLHCFPHFKKKPPMSIMVEIQSVCFLIHLYLAHQNIFSELSSLVAKMLCGPFPLKQLNCSLSSAYTNAKEG